MFCVGFFRARTEYDRLGRWAFLINACGPLGCIGLYLAGVALNAMSGEVGRGALLEVLLPVYMLAKLAMLWRP